MSELKDINDRCVRIENKLDVALERSVRNETRLNGMRHQLTALWTFCVGATTAAVAKLFGG